MTIPGEDIERGWTFYLFCDEGFFLKAYDSYKFRLEVSQV